MVQNLIEIIYKKFKERTIFKMRKPLRVFPFKLVDTKVLVDMSQILLLNFCMESFIFTWGDLQLQKISTLISFIG